jgi:hypothetical protein
MGLGPASIKLYLELWNRGLLANTKSVLEMGSQEIHLTKAHFEGLVHSAGLSDYDDKQFSELANWPGAPRCPAKKFYQLLGIEEYSCFDLNEELGGIPHDLNEPLTDSTYYGKYDLVTDHGTNEHIFNISETYRTMHRLCKIGGLLVIHQSLYGGNGYYNFDLSFFEGMAAANGYQILFSSFTVTLNRKNLNAEELRELPRELNGSLGRDQFHIPLSNELLDVVDWSKDRAEIGICYVFQKKLDADFQYAYQGKYLTEIQGNHGYQLQFLPNPPARSYVPLISWSPKRMQGGVLEATPFRTLIQHLIWRLGKRAKVRIGL